MTSAKWVAYSTLAVSVTTLTAGAALGALHGGFGDDPAGTVGLYLAFGSFMVVGAVIVARRPENAIGWVFSAIGLLFGVGGFAEAYSVYALVTKSGSIPGGELMAWVNSWYWYPAFGLVVLFVPLLFPTGLLLSRRWRPVLWLAVAQLGAITVLAALNPSLEVSVGVSVPNPMGVTSVGNIEETTVGQALLGLVLIPVAAAVASLVLRFRRSRSEERQQLKWFTFAAALLFGNILIQALLTPLGTSTDLLFAVTVGLLPATAGIAVVKYRLYEIDRIINRTLVYAFLTGLLALAYWGLAVSLGGVMREVTGSESNDLVVAASTLAVAGLFGPLRRRMQRFVDRRFYRRHYDAARALEAFSSRLRNEVDLGELR
jgi:hypothetical protein